MKNLYNVEELNTLITRDVNSVFFFKIHEKSEFDVHLYKNIYKSILDKDISELNLNVLHNFQIELLRILVNQVNPNDYFTMANVNTEVCQELIIRMVEMIKYKIDYNKDIEKKLDKEFVLASKYL